MNSTESTRPAPPAPGALVAGWATLSRVTVQPELPRKASQIRHDLDDLYELMSQVDQSQTRTAGVLQRHNNRFEELQQTLDLHGGRLDRIEDNQRRQFDLLSAQMAEILGALRGPATAGPAPEPER